MNSTLETSIPTREDVEQFVYSLFKNETSYKGETIGKIVTPDTPCSDFFPYSKEEQASRIGKPIEETFGLEKLMFQQALSNHEFDERLGKYQKAFYNKYHFSELPTNKHTLKRFSEMVHDLILIKNNQPPS